MGSLEEFKAAVSFISQHQLKPVVHTILDGLESFEDGFELIKSGEQFGKIVIRIEKNGKGKL